MIKSHTFNGRKYEIEVDEPYFGYCDQYKPFVPRLSMPIGLPSYGNPGRTAMDTLIHECLHAENWRAKEEHVTVVASRIANALWTVKKIDPRYNERQFLLHLIYKNLIASNWANNSKISKRIATEIGSLMWRLGFRKSKTTGYRRVKTAKTTSGYRSSGHLKKGQPIYV